MPTVDQKLKMWGKLPNVRLRDLGTSFARDEAMARSEDVDFKRDCGHPDAYDEEIANATPTELQLYLGMDQLENVEALKQAHLRWLVSEEAGSGSWPTGCHQDLYPHPNHHCVTYYIKRETFKNNYTRTAGDDEIRHLANAGVWGLSETEMLDRWSGKSILDISPWFIEEGMRRISVKFIQTEVKSKADIILLSRWISGGNGTIGIGWFPGSTCTGNVVESHYDSGWRPRLYRAILLFLHELGHNLKFQHTFRNQSRHKGVMSYSWPNNCYGFLTGEENILPRDPAWSQANRYYDSTDSPLPDGPIITPPPATGLVLPGSFWGERLPNGQIAFRGGATVPKGLANDTNVIAYPDPEQQGRYILKEPPVV